MSPITRRGALSLIPAAGAALAPLSVAVARQLDETPYQRVRRLGREFAQALLDMDESGERMGATILAVDARTNREPDFFVVNDEGIPDELHAAITAFREGEAAANAAPASDRNAWDRLAGPHFVKLDGWDAPALTRSGALAALRLALDEAVDGCDGLQGSLVRAALRYFEGRRA